MTMATIAMKFKVEAEHVVDALQETREHLDSADAAVVLDFSSVRRIDPAALQAMEDLAATADEKTVKVGLHGVNVNIYKVLKLTKLAPRFSFTWDAQPRATEQEIRHAEPTAQ